MSELTLNERIRLFSGSPPRHLAASVSYSEHLVLFMDLLGVRETDFIDSDRASGLIRLLIRLSQLQETIAYAANIDGALIKPELTAFSDNIVYSYPIPSLKSDSIGSLVNLMRHTITEASIYAFNSNTLVRGGMTIGPLFHEKGVVCGSALIEAYHIESSIANYPRVIISQNLLNSTSVTAMIGREVRKDYDGLYYLDYIPGLMMECADMEFRDQDWIVRCGKWYRKACAIVDNNIKYLKEQNKLKEAIKWEWFRRHLETTGKEMSGISGKTFGKI